MIKGHAASLISRMFDSFISYNEEKTIVLNIINLSISIHLRHLSCISWLLPVPISIVAWVFLHTPGPLALIIVNPIHRQIHLL